MSLIFKIGDIVIGTDVFTPNEIERIMPVRITKIETNPNDTQFIWTDGRYKQLVYTNVWFQKATSADILNYKANYDREICTSSD